jgi:hypothetical protein
LYNSDGWQKSETLLGKPTLPLPQRECFLMRSSSRDRQIHTKKGRVTIEGGLARGSLCEKTHGFSQHFKATSASALVDWE